MPSLYDRLTTTSAGLLAKFKQGTVEIGTTTTTAGADEWDPPTQSTTWVEVDAIVSGVSSKYVDGVKILASDLQVLAQATVSAGQLVRIDGEVVTVLAIKPVPAAGDPVVTRLIVKG